MVDPDLNNELEASVECDRESRDQSNLQTTQCPDLGLDTEQQDAIIENNNNRVACSDGGVSSRLMTNENVTDAHANVDSTQSTTRSICSRNFSDAEVDCILSLSQHVDRIDDEWNEDTLEFSEGGARITNISSGDEGMKKDEKERTGIALHTRTEAMSDISTSQIPNKRENLDIGRVTTISFMSNRGSQEEHPEASTDHEINPLDDDFTDNAITYNNTNYSSIEGTLVTAELVEPELDRLASDNKPKNNVNDGLPIERENNFLLVEAKPITPSDSIQHEYDPSQQMVVSTRLVRTVIIFVVCVFLFLIIGTVHELVAENSKDKKKSKSSEAGRNVTTGFDVFRTTKELYDAVDRYSEYNAELASRYGFPIGIWDVSRIEDFSNLFNIVRQENASSNTPVYHFSVADDDTVVAQEYELSVVPFHVDIQSLNDFNENISNWNVSSATKMDGMFANTLKFNQSLASWDVTKVTDFSYTFFNATGITGSHLGLENWNTSSGRNMSHMFAYTSSLGTVDLTKWDVRNVVTMDSMFKESPTFGGNLSNWDVSRVESFRAMFKCAKTFNEDLSQWIVSSASDISKMFQNATSFNAEIVNWDVSNVTMMDYAFFGASNFQQNLCDWKAILMTAAVPIMIDNAFVGTNCSTMVIDVTVLNDTAFCFQCIE